MTNCDRIVGLRFLNIKETYKKYVTNNTLANKTITSCCQYNIDKSLGSIFIMKLQEETNIIHYSYF